MNIYTKSCLYCEKEFSIKDLKPSARKRRKFCSRGCASRWAAKQPRIQKIKSETAKRCWKDPNYRNKQTQCLHNRWAKLSEDERHDWYNKMIKSVDLDKRRDNALFTKLYNGDINQIYYMGKSPKYRKYKNIVNVYTQYNRKKYFSNIKFSKHGNHLDHIFPTQKGFYYNIPPELMGDIRNLQVLLESRNKQKSNKIEQIPQHILDHFFGAFI